MTAAFVADASIGVAWALPSQASQSTDRLRTEVAEGRPFVVPGLWMLEVANTFLVLTRRGKLDGAQRVRACRGLRLLHPILDDQAPLVAFEQISDLAIAQALSVYDATYLELSLRLGLPLATRDEALKKAARRCGAQSLIA